MGEAMPKEITCGPCLHGHTRACYVARGLWVCVCPCRKQRLHKARHIPRLSDFRSMQGRGVYFVNDDTGWAHSIVGDFSIRLDPVGK